MVAFITMVTALVIEVPMASTVSKSALKAHMLELFRQVEDTGEELVVTSHGRPVLKVIPFRRAEGVEEVMGDLRGRVRLPDEATLTAPVDPAEFADSELRELL